MQKILVIRMMGLGDVASILIPAVKLIHARHADALVDVLTYGPGNELMQLVPEVNAVLTVTPEQWPDDIHPAVASFMQIAAVVGAQHYDLVINLDTWFMPCFLARLLMEAGVPAEGNVTRLSIASFFESLKENRLTQDYLQTPQHYLESSFRNMPDWFLPWWDKYPDSGSYPEFYLLHCCGLGYAIDISLVVEADEAFRHHAQGKKIVALSTSGSKPGKQYRQHARLRQLLEQAGYQVWGEFDGGTPMQTTLGRLKVTDLLITVPTSTQWLARLVGCPALMIPGPLPPQVLGAELVVERVLGCQYCYQKNCRENLDFACMDIAPEAIVSQVRQYFESKHLKA